MSNMSACSRVESSRQSASAATTAMSLLNIERLDGGGLSIRGMVVAAYCNIFLVIMGCVFLGGGSLLTAISYRPQEYGEDLGDWRTR